MQLPLYCKEAVGEAVFLSVISAPDCMEKAMSEEKIEIEQIEEFTEELSDEALDREVARGCMCAQCQGGCASVGICS